MDLIVSIIIVGVLLGLVRAAPLIPEFFKLCIYAIGLLWLFLHALDYFGWYQGFWHHGRR